MRKRVYISADYSIYDGDHDVIDALHSWGNANSIRWFARSMDQQLPRDLMMMSEE